MGVHLLDDELGGGCVDRLDLVEALGPRALPGIARFRAGGNGDVFPSGQQSQIRIMLSESLKAIISQQIVQCKDNHGNVVAMEILVNTGAISSLIRDNKLYQIPSMITAGQDHGMISMDQSLINLIKDDLISLDEAYARAYDKNQFDSYLRDLKGKSPR